MPEFGQSRTGTTAPGAIPANAPTAVAYLADHGALLHVARRSSAAAGPVCLIALPKRGGPIGLTDSGRSAGAGGQSLRSMLAGMQQREAAERSRLTLWQWLALRELHRRAGKPGSEPLSSEDWAALWQLHDTAVSRAMHRVWKALPHSPRCGMCSAPFAGWGRLVVRPLGYRPSRKNPTICAVCVESSPPGGMKMYAGILFADVRGFTARSEGADPEEVSNLLRRFYRCAEDVLFPDAIIDKLIGDEVMALYLPDIQKRVSRSEVPALMLEHARGLLRAVGYGSAAGPFIEMGVGLDVGEAFVGNIGERALYDFTAVGDVVNTASRLQRQAAGGEIVLSQRVAEDLPAPIGAPVQLPLPGKREPQNVYRVNI